MSNELLTLLTVDELSKALKISKSNIYKLIKASKIPYVKISKKYLFEETTINDWVKSNSYTPSNA
jgi:excisionase family DNA binding protein